MNRDRIVPLVFALLAVVALAAAAATLNTTNTGAGTGTGDDTGIGDGGPTFDLGSRSPLNPSTLDDPFLKLLFRAIYFLLLLVAVIGLIARIYEKGWRSMLSIVGVLILTVILSLILYYISFLRDGAKQNRTGKRGLIGERQISLPGGGSEVPSVINTDITVIVFAVLAVSILAVALVLRRSDTPILRRSGTETGEPDDEPSPESVAVGDAAGRAADRIETETQLSNAIYRAWQEMTTHLDLPQETSTPGEFATAAVATGMERDDVAELTELFESTRYGGIDATEERERRALSVLRRIEQAYGEEREEGQE